MSPDNSSLYPFSTPARRLLLACTLGCFLLAVHPAAAQPPGLSHARGHAGLAQLATRLPAVAAQHNMAAARLRELFLADPHPAVDEADNLLFIDEFTPEEAAGAAGTGVGGALALQPLSDAFFLHSLPGATKVIYLDFDGHTTTGTSWNGGATIVSAPFSIDADTAFSADRTRAHPVHLAARRGGLPPVRGGCHDAGSGGRGAPKARNRRPGLGPARRRLADQLVQHRGGRRGLHRLLQLEQRHAVLRVHGAAWHRQ